MNDNFSRSLAVVAIVIAIGGYFFPSIAPHAFGGVTNYDEVDTTALKVGGSNGSRVGPIIIGTGALISANVSVAASSSQEFDIAVTGVVPGDSVNAQIASSTVASSLGWQVRSAIASSTAGFVAVVLSNLTGAAANPHTAGIDSAVMYEVFHPVTSVPGL